MRSTFTIDSRRVYTTGVSAGGVMTNIMAVTYPDIFAAASIMAGCEYERDVLQLRSPTQSGLDALSEMGSRARPVPAVIWQGTADIVVPPATAYRIAGQWTTVGHTDSIADTIEYAQVPGNRSYTHLTYRTAGGQPPLDQCMIDGAGHAYPGGCSCSLYGDPAGPDATRISWDFFLAHPMGTV